MSQPDEIDPIPTPIDRDRICGSLHAPIVLIEYGDYDCSQSCRGYVLFKQLQIQLGNRISFVFRHFPLTPQAQKAAETAEAAAAQNRFWQMHELLCQHSQALADADFVEYAVQLNLDIPQFLTEIADRVHQQRVQRDLDRGRQLGFTATPIFFIRIRCERDRDFESILQAVLKVISA